MHNRKTLRSLLFDSLEEQIAVIDEKGTIVDVNAAWTSFGVENGLSPDFISIGNNYLETTRRSSAEGDILAGKAAQGIMDVMAGTRASFHHEYPCDSPTERRWFMMLVSPLKGYKRRMLILSHYNITTRKLAEEQVEHLARHDSLTGLANRRYFNEFLNSEILRCRRNKSMLSLILIDADHFKAYNDELGHLAGDHCLTKIGKALLPFARRPSDLAARLGGDEFALVLGNTDYDESLSIAEAIRKAVSALNLLYARTRQITVSVGVAAVTPDESQTTDFLLQEADKALYGAKAAGRNQVFRGKS